MGFHCSSWGFKMTKRNMPFPHFGITFVTVCVLSLCVSENAPSVSSLEASVVSSIFYVRKGDAELPCEINLKKLSELSSSQSNRSKIIPKWTKITGSRVDMASECQDEKVDDDDFKCGIVLTSKGANPDAKDSNEIITSMLRIRKVSDDDYGTYECSVSQPSTDNVDQHKTIITTLELRDALTVTRRSLDKGTKERSVIIQVEETLELYCNYTGVGSEHTVLWFKDEKNITEDLKNPSSSRLFENFTQNGEYEFHGKVSHEHRGYYTCSVELKNSDGIDHSVNFPVQFTFHVRVREGNRWILPASILAGEIVLLGALTILWWRKVEGVEGGIDGNYADSDDEDQEEK